MQSVALDHRIRKLMGGKRSTLISKIERDESYGPIG